MKININNQIIDFDDNSDFWKTQIESLGILEAKNLYFYLFHVCKIPKVLSKYSDQKTKSQYKVTYDNLAGETIVAILAISNEKIIVIEGDICIYETDNLSDAVIEAEEFLAKEGYSIVDITNI